MLFRFRYAYKYNSYKNNQLINTTGVSIHELQRETDFNLIKKSGISIVRDAFVWDIIEKEKGVYNFSNNGLINYDEFIQKYKNNHIRPYIMLLYSNKLYSNEENINNHEVKDAYSKWAAECAKRYKNNHIIWEIYNEPNLETFWKPQVNSAYHYTNVVKKVAPLIKKNDPTATVVAPALSGLGDVSLPWMEETFRQGILNYIDAISVHPYRDSNPESVIEDYYKLKELISKYTKKDMPIISSEWGYSNVIKKESESNSHTVSNELEQAQYISRMILINQYQNIKYSIVYEWKDDGQNRYSIEHNFGLYKYNQKTPKKAGLALEILIKTLGDYKFIERIDTGRNEDYLFKYLNREGQTAYAFWTTNSEHSFILNDKVNGDVISMLGKKRKIKGKNLSLQLYQSPTYIINK